jgi:hypothetical protein
MNEKILARIRPLGWTANETGELRPPAEGRRLRCRHREPVRLFRW